MKYLFPSLYFYVLAEWFAMNLCYFCDEKEQYTYFKNSTAIHASLLAAREVETP